MELRSFIRDVPDFPKPGIVFKDITPLLASPAALAEAVRRIAAPYQADRIDRVVAAEARGFIFGGAVALQLGAGFVPVRKPGKLPWRTVAKTYDLEYGQDTLCMHEDALLEGQKVLLLDDVLATGGTMQAIAAMAAAMGAEIVGCAFLVELSFLGGRSRLPGIEVTSLIQY